MANKPVVNRSERTLLTVAAVAVLFSLIAVGCSFVEDVGSAIGDSFSSLGAEEEVAIDSSPAEVDPPESATSTAEAATVTAAATVTEATPVPEATTQAPTPTPEPTAIPEPTAEATATPTPTVVNGCAVPPVAQPDPNRPRYDVSLDIDVPTSLVKGQATITFTPDLPIDAVELRLWPNSPRSADAGSEMTLTSATIDGTSVALTELAPTLIELALPARVAANESVTIETEFELKVAAAHRGRVAGSGSFLRLGSILPTLAWEPGVGWAREPATALFAEAASSPSADYRVEIRGTDGFDVLATGEQETPMVWTAVAVRDFSLSVGRFRTVEGVAMAPDPVVITVGSHEGVADDPQVYLDKVTAVLEDYSSRWGAYPWPTLTIALTPELRGGIEFPTHIMQGPETIGRTTSHEIGHMYFYSLVGSNQGRTPWLDEGLATYAEFLAENFNADVIAIPSSALGRSGESMEYWAEHRADYYNSVYLYPGVAIASLGSTEDIDCALRRYVAVNAYSIAEPADFFDAFDDVFPDVVEALAPYGLTP